MASRKRPSSRAKEVLRAFGLSQRVFLSEDDTHVYTSLGTLVWQQGAFRKEAVDCGPAVGTNACGHRLPAGGGAD